MPKFCHHCGAQLNDDAGFCRVCGTKQHPLQQGQQNAIPIQQAVTQTNTIQPLQREMPPKNNKGLMAAAAVVIVVIVALCFYFFYWIKTPAYSLNIIRKAVQEHNLITFEQHVDLRSVYSHGMDDIFRSYMRTQGATSSESESDFVKGIYSLIKGSLVDAMVDTTREYVKTGKLDNSKQENPGDVQGAIKQGIKKEISKDVVDKDSSELEFKGIDSTVKNGQEATVTVKIGAKNKTKEILVPLKMKELVNGEWQVTEIPNLSDILNLASDANNGNNNAGSSSKAPVASQPAQTNGFSLSESAVRALNNDATNRKNKEVAETWGSKEKMNSLTLVEHWVLNANSNNAMPRNIVYMVYRIQAQNAEEGTFQYFYYFKYANVDAQGNASGAPSLPQGEYDSGEAFTTGNHVRGQCNYYTGYRNIESLRNRITADAGTRYNAQKYYE